MRLERRLDRLNVTLITMADPSSSSSYRNTVVEEDDDDDDLDGLDGQCLHPQQQLADPAPQTSSHLSTRRARRRLHRRTSHPPLRPRLQRPSQRYLLLVLQDPKTTETLKHRW